jgi:hypothetical protein
MTQSEAFTAGSDPFTPGGRAANCLGRSREPPVLTRFGQISVETKFARAERCAGKAGPLQALGHRASRQRATPFDPFEDSLPAIVRSRIHHGCESVGRRRDDENDGDGLIALYRLRLLVHQERLYPGENLGRDECDHGCDSFTILQF